MEAKDTVMSPNQIVEAMSEWKDDNGISWEDWSTVMGKQAEISFKAGYEKGIEFLDLTSETQYRAGINEVVEWIKSHHLIEPDANSITMFYPFYQIEARELKEWGINEETK